MDSSHKILVAQLILAGLAISVATPTETKRQIPELFGMIQNVFGGSRSRCPEYARNDCQQICQPNDFKLDCEAYPERPAACMCFCPSLNPLYNFCEYIPSSYCSITCGRGGIGYRCIGPSGAQQCACFCPADRQAFEAHFKATRTKSIAETAGTELGMNVNGTSSVDPNAPVWWSDLDI